MKETAMPAPRLEAFRVAPVVPFIVPCTPERTWMDAVAGPNASPSPALSVANTHGWELLIPAAFEVEWNGGPLSSDLTLRAIEPFPDGFPFERFATADLAHGIVSFHTGYVFRTPPRWNLLATGAFNEPRTGIAALTG